MSALESIGRYAFSVIGLEITLCPCSNSERTPRTVRRFQGLELGYQDLVNIFGQREIHVTNTCYDF